MVDCVVGRAKDRRSMQVFVDLGGGRPFAEVKVAC